MRYGHFIDFLDVFWRRGRKMFCGGARRASTRTTTGTAIRAQTGREACGGLFLRFCLVIGTALAASSIVPAVQAQAPVFDGASHTFEIDENQPVGTTIGRVRATASGSRDTITYSIESIEGFIGADYLTIGPNTGVIRSGRVFDYEFSPVLMASIRAVDKDGNQSDSTLTVIVRNVNEPGRIELGHTGEGTYRQGSPIWAKLGDPELECGELLSCPGLSFRWERSTNGGTTWTTIMATAPPDNIVSTYTPGSADIGRRVWIRVRAYYDDALQNAQSVTSEMIRVLGRQEPQGFDLVLTTSAEGGSRFAVISSLMEDAGPIVVTAVVELDPGFSEDHVVDVTLTGSGEEGRVGFTSQSSTRPRTFPVTFTFDAGVVSEGFLFFLVPLDDDVFTEDEVVTVTAQFRGTLLTSSAEIRIVNDEPLPIALSATPARVEEGRSGGFTVTASYPDGITRPYPAVVTLSVADGTGSRPATEGTDFRAGSSITVTIPPKRSSVTATNVSLLDEVIDDAPLEGDETLILSGTATGGHFEVLPTTLTITDNDTAALTLNDVTVAESPGSTGTVTATVTVNLDNDVQGGFTVMISTRDGTATAPGDYTSTTTTLTFDGSAETKTFTVEVAADSIFEGTEMFGVELFGLSTALNVGIPDPATITITDDAADVATLRLVAPDMPVREAAFASATITATLDNPVQGGFTVTVSTTSTVDDMAVPGLDYTPITSRTLTFPDGSTQQKFEVVILDDLAVEREETFHLSLGGLAGTMLPVQLGPDAIVRIVTEDSVFITWGLSEPVGEGMVAVVTARLHSPVEGGFTVPVMIGGGTATGGSDYTPTSGTLTFDGDATETETFEVMIHDDTVVESQETFQVSLGNVVLTPASAPPPPEASLNFSSGQAVTVAIIDNDTASDLIILSLTPSEVNEDVGTMAVTVTAAFPENSPVLQTDTTVMVSVGADGDLTTEGTDYTTVDDFPVTIPANMTSGSGTFDLVVAGDTLVEEDETLTVSGTSGTLSVASATLTITDGDIPPTAITLSVDPTSVTEGSNGSTTTTQVMVTALLSGSSATLPSPTEVALSVGSGTDSATEGTDYTEIGGTIMVTIEAGARSGTASFNLEVIGDTLVEGNETLTVSGTSDTLSVTSATLTITDDDIPPEAITLSVNPTHITEGSSSGTTQVTVTASISGSSSTLSSSIELVLSVGADTDSATEGTDYTETGGTITVTIAPGTTSGSATFDLEVTGDTLAEGDETVTVSGPSGVLSVASAMLTIADDDTAPTAIALSLSSPSVDEDSDTTSVTVTAAFSSEGSGTLTADTEVAVTVAGGTATEGTDYTADPATITVTIEAGTTSGTESFDLVVRPDVVAEGDEIVTVSGLAGGFTISDAMVTILDDDDDDVWLILGDGAISEGAPADLRSVRIPALLNVAVQGGFTVEASTADGSATAGEDYTAAIRHPLHFAGNAWEEQVVTMMVLPDSVAEGDETFTVSLGDLSGNAVPIATSGMVTVTIFDDDDDNVRVTLGAASVYENLSSVTVTATLNVAVQGGFTVQASTVDGSAIAGEDYTTVTGQTLNFIGSLGEEQTFTVPILPDSVAEIDETFTVSLSGLSGNAPEINTSSTALVTIFDDDSVTVTLGAASVSEDLSSVTVTATLNVAVQESFTVEVSTADGSATAGSDYTAVTGALLSFNGVAGETATFDLMVMDDNIHEGNETLILSGMASRPGMTVFDATLTIIDDDDAPTGITLAVSPTSVPEGSSGSTTTTAVTVTASFSGSSSARTSATEVTVSVAAGGGSPATGEGTDFVTVSDFTVTIDAGATSGSATFDLEVTGDTLVEGNETLTVSGSADLSVASATLTITDDDAAPTGITLAVSPTSVPEGSNGGTTTTAITVTASFSGSSSTRTTATEVTVSVAGVSATGEGTDFADVTDFTVTIGAGATSGSATFDLEVTGDTLVEGNETLTVSGSADLSVAAATLTITDDDDAPTGITLVLSPTSVPEGSSGSTTTTAITVTASFSGSSSTRTTATEVTVSVAGVSATGEGTDFADVTDFTVTIGAGATSGSATFDLEVTGDTLVEGNETLTVSGAADLPVAAATLTITDDDDAPTGITLAVSPTSVPEGSSGSTTTTAITVTASFSGSSSTRTTATEVTVSVAGVSATGEGTDFATVSDFTVTIDAGATSGSDTFDLEVTGDTLVEGPETLTVSGSADLSVAPATLTITDDDTDPTGITLVVSPTSVREGSKGSTTTAITVTASFSGSSAVRTTATEVTVSVAGGGTSPATGEGMDFATVSDFTVTIDAGATSGSDTFDLEVTGDTRVEGPETLTVSGLAGLSVAPATLTITDDDDPPTGITLAVSPTSVLEGSSGSTTTTAIKVTASFSGSSAVRTTATEVTVSVAGGGTSPATGDGTDFATVSDFTVTIDAGATSGSATFDLEVTGDTLVEGNETLTVSGSADLSVAPATLTITDDDDALTGITLAVSPTSVREGSKGSTTTAIKVTASFSGSSAVRTTATEVTVSVAGGGTSPATGDGTDFATVSDFTVTIDAGATSGSATFDLEVTGDTLVEGNETLTVSGLADLSVASATLTITDDDDAPTGITLAVGPTSVLEGSKGSTTTAIKVTASFSGSSAVRTTATKVTVSVAGGGTSPATGDGTDFARVSDFTVTIDAGATSGSATFDLEVTGDTLVEGNETLTVSGSADLSVAPAILTITDDDDAPTGITLAVSPTSVPEGSSGSTTTTAITVTASFSGSSSTRTTATEVTVSVAGVSATGEGTDFADVTDFAVTIVPGTTSGSDTFDLVVAGDTLVEGDETLTVTGLADLSVAPATLTITDDDDAPTGITLVLSPTSVPEGSSGSTTTTAITVTASFSGSSSTRTSATEVTVSVAGVSATGEGTDFADVTDFAVTIAPGTTSGSATFDLEVAGDTLVEGNETLTVSGLADLSVAPATLTITDDDDAPTGITLVLSPTSVPEGSSGSTTTTAITVTASFSGSSSTRTTATEVTVSVAGVSATGEGTDFADVTDFAVTIAPGTTSGSATFDLEVTGDTLVEGPETLTVSGSADLSVAPAILTITDDDDAPTGITLAVSPTSVPEGGSGSTTTTAITVTASFSGSSSTRTTATEVTVSVAGGGGSPATGEGTDFADVTDFTVTIAPGTTSGSATFDLEVTDDTLVEGPETLTVSGSADLPVASATLTITDDDDAPTGITLAVSPTSVPEGSNGGTTTTAITVTASFSGSSSTRTATTEVTVSVAGVSATGEGTDFATVSDFTVTIDAGATSGSDTFDLEVTGDTLVEGPETLTVSGSADLSVAPATLTITDDDDAPTGITLAVSPTSVPEGSNGGTTTTAITVTASFSGSSSTRTAATEVTVSVAGVSATGEGTDFATVSDFTVTIDAGATSGSDTFDLEVTDDTLVEGPETLMVSGSADLSVAPATLTITDDDTAPTAIDLSLSFLSVDEDSDTTSVTVMAAFSSEGSGTLTADTEVAVTVADGTATVGMDFTADPATITVTIEAGTTSGTESFDLVVRPDTVAEGDETVTVSGMAGGFTISDATVTILDDDDENVWLILGGAAISEGVSADFRSVRVPAVLNVAVQGGFTVEASTADGSATAGEDYTAATRHPLHFTGNAWEEQVVTVTILPDSVAEGDETFTVSLGGLSGNAVAIDISAIVPVRILDDDDDNVRVTLGVAEVSEDLSSVTVTATLNVAVQGGLTVQASTVDGSATAGEDYTTVTGQTLNFIGSLGEEQTFTVPILPDSVAEGDETFTVLLGGLSGNAPEVDISSTALVTITDDDDDNVRVTLGVAEVSEDLSSVTVTATLNVAVQGGFTVQASTADGSATAGEDYTTVTGQTLNFDGDSGEEETFTATILPDSVAEGDETFTVSLTGLSGNAVAVDTSSTALVTITEDDTAPTAIVLSLSQAGADEGASPTVTVTAMLSPTSITLLTDTTVTVAVGVGGDSATEGTDYTSVADFTVTIAAGATSGTGTFQFAPTDDVVADPGETATVSGTAGGFGITDLTLAINDNDTAPTVITLSLNSSRVNEGDTTAVTVTAAYPGSVTLTADTVVMVTVGADTAIEADFTAPGSIMVTIAAGANSGMASFSLEVLEDTINAGVGVVDGVLSIVDEVLTVSGTADGFAVTSAAMTILDNDETREIVLSLSQTEAEEGASPTVTVTATLSPIGVTLPIDIWVSVTVGDSGDSATEGTDYTTVDDLTFTIAAGATSGTGTFQFAVTDDEVADPGETVTVSGGAHEFGRTNATLAINDTDTAPTVIVLSLSEASVAEGTSATVTMTATLSPASVTLTADTTVSVAVGDGEDSATEGTDYTMVDDLTVIIAGGATSGTGTFQFAPADDAVADPGESVTVSGTAGGFDITDLTLAINDNDPAPTAIVLSLSQADADEGASATVTMTATLSPSSITLPDTTVVTVAVGAGGDSATEGTDYTTVADLTVTIAAGATSGTGTFEFAVTDDEVADPGETVTVSGSAGGFAITDLTLAITDTDTAPTAIVLSLSQAGAEEGASPTVTVTATLSPDSITLPADTPVSVTVGDSGDSATEGTDYTMVDDLTVIIAGGATSGTGTFQFAPADDAVADPGESVTVSGTAGGFTFTNATLAITDTDTAPTAIVLSLSQAGADEGASPTVTVTATLSPDSITLPADTPVSVTVGDSGDSATEGTDYTTVADLTVTIAAGATSGTGTFEFAVTDDEVADPGETVTVSGTAGGFSFTDTELAITDNDTAPTAMVLSLSQAGAEEGASPTVTVTATLSPDSITLPDATVVTVAVGDSDDTATEGTDYTMVDDLTVTISAGATSGTGTFQFAPTDDAVADPGETVTVSGTAGGFTFTNATLAINDTDTAPTAIVLSLSQAGADEGASATVTVTATLSPTSVTLTDATVVTVAVGAGGDLATEGTDYTTVADLTVTIAAGATSGTGTFEFAVTDDEVADPGETVTVSGSAGGFAITDLTLAINDTDTAPTVIVLGLSQVGADEGASPTVTVTATLSPDSITLPVDTPVSVTVGDSGDSATEGTDYTTVAGLTVTIAAGATSGTGTFEFAVTDDEVADPGETVTVSGSAGGFTFTNATLAITDTDTAPTAMVLSLSQAGAEEGASPTVTVTATLSPDSITLPAATPVSVTVGDSGDSATEGTDYTMVDDLTITIAAGTTSNTVTFQFAVTDDEVADPGETVTVSGTAGGFSFTDTELAITDNDTAPTAMVLSLSQAGAGEGASPTVTVTATLSPDSITLPDATVVTVVVGDSDDTATEGTDYTMVDDLTITIAAGTTSNTVTFEFAVTDDEVADPGETVTVSGTAGGFSFTDTELAITDNDTAPTAMVLSLSQAGAEEGASPTVTVTATLSPTSITLPTDTTVTVTVGDSDDTATEGTDYTMVDDLTITIAAGTTSNTATFQFAPTDDAVADPGETVTVSGTAGGFSFTDTELAINDTDTAPTAIVLSLSQAGADEGASATVTVTATLSPTSVTLTDATVVTVAVGAGGDSATEGTDYTTVADLTVTIAAGATSGTGTFEFAVTDDEVADPGETVTVSGTAGGFSFTDTELAITDNDTAPTAIVLSLSQATPVVEGDSPTVTVTATLSPTSITLPDATVVTVAVGAGGDSATEGTDYTMVDDLTVTIAAGATSGTGTFEFAVTDDEVADPGETVTVSGTAGGFSFTDTELAITDNDTAPTAIVLSLNQAGAGEGDSPTVTVTATLSPDSITLPDATVVTVAVGDSDDTATEGTDYTMVA